MRELLVRLHRWAGLATALFLIAAGLTGSALAFKHELEAALNPRLFRVTPPARDPGAGLRDPFVLREQVERRYPHARVDHLSFPAAGSSTMFYLTPRRDRSTGQGEPLDKDQVFLDPYTGQWLGDRQWGVLFAEGRFQRENIVPFIWRLHEALALPHPWGKWLMGAIALIWTVDGFIGLWLTFPRGRPFLPKWGIAWKIKRGASTHRLTLDIHRASGLWLWLLLLVFAWSSVMLNLRDSVYRPVMSLAFEFGVEQPPRLPQPRWTPALDWRQAHEVARLALAAMAARDGFEVKAEDSLWYRPAQGAYLYRTQTSADVRTQGAGSDLWIDADTGAVVAVRHEGRARSGDAVSAWLRALHTGEVFGVGYRILVAWVGVVLAALSVTGIMLWSAKRTARKRGSTVSRVRGLTSPP